mmetsp:Transcript_56984/g.101053  ORF Transcript_56984/g.101053 Transcript_56984/m.101053 type:complete len:324 (-) Transcript_56984:122-1093(-)
MSELRQRKPQGKPEGKENEENEEKPQETLEGNKKEEVADENEIQETKTESKQVEKKEEAKKEPMTWAEWTCDESHEMMLAMIPGIPGESVEEKLESALIKYNPVYWGAWLATGVMLVGGRLVHMLFGQGGKVRDDELEAEHEVRVQWIYANDVLYFVSIITDIWALGQEVDLLLFHRHVAEGHSEAAGVLISTTLLVLTVAGNIAFFTAMSRRDQLGVRAAVAGNAGFAAIMTCLMCKGIHRRFTHGKAMKLLSKSWAFRAMTVVFAIMAVPCYAKLWNAYEEKPGTTQLHRVIVVLVPFFGVFGIVLGAFLLDHHALWEAFG